MAGSTDRHRTSASAELVAEQFIEAVRASNADLEPPSRISELDYQQAKAKVAKYLASLDDPTDAAA